MTSSGQLKIKLSKPIVEFPENFKSLVERNSKGYVESNGEIVPDINAEPWISPLIILKLIAGDQTDGRKLKYTWELEEYTETLITLQLTFITPLKVSLNTVPEKLYIELRIQKYHDADGFGIEH